MKDRFRTKFDSAEAGWVVQHSYFGIFWTIVGDNVYPEKRYADAALGYYTDGVSPDSRWSTKKEKKND